MYLLLLRSRRTNSLLDNCPLPSPLFKILANNPYAKPLRLAERAGISPRSYRVVGQAELGMSQKAIPIATIHSIISAYNSNYLSIDHI